ncbi:MAG: aspartate-semialdehyde dehydrogenase [Gammaproteobacteria bacterium RIFCSPHIGHO2_12_FULL_41_15]|nr:MAG: aspartate-semialdehyde dehydrogenase [Gammaproteobacteria bacterium RIFCSPHIGHO2_12_FULL_41_15]
MKKKRTIAVVGATGVVGENILSILAERKFPVETIHPLASDRSLGKTVNFGRKILDVEMLEGFDFKGVDIAFFSAGGEISKQYVPIAAAAGAVVIDNTSAFRYENDIPLVVPEVNPSAVKDYKNRHIIANPNCSTIQMVVALKPIYDAYGIERITVATYQAVSGAGRRAIEELSNQVQQMFRLEEMERTIFNKQIAFNVLPEIDVFLENGFTKEEMKMVWETKKIFGDDSIQVNATAVRVPVFFGHSEAIFVETKKALGSLEEIYALLEKAEGVCLMQKDYPTPALNAAHHDDVFVGRVRKDLTKDNALNLWVVADNIRKGAALNAVQIAELL